MSRDLAAYRDPEHGALAFIAAELTAANGARIGDLLPADPWIERDVLRPILARGPEGLPLHSLAYVELSRGHAKSSYAAAIATSEVVLHDSTDVAIIAADKEQAGFITEHIDRFLRDNPDLGRSFTTKDGEWNVPSRRSRIRVISSDVASSWGMGGTHKRFRVICDELTAWPARGEDLWTSVVSATGKVADVQVVVLSNAGFDSANSWQWKAREIARTATYGYLFTAPGVIASWVTPQWVEQMRDLLPGPAFDRVIGNVWTSQSGDFVTREEWRRCVDPDWQRQSAAEDGRRYFGGLDLGLTRDRTAFALAHLDGMAAIRLDELLVWQGTKAEPVSIEAIERAMADVSERFDRPTLLADPWQLKGSIERLQHQGVRMEEFIFSASSVARLSTALYSAIKSGRLRVFEDPELEAEILGLRVVQTSGGWRVDHRSGGFSDRAMAIAMAVHAAFDGGVSGATASISTLPVPAAQRFIRRGDLTLPDDPRYRDLTAPGEAPVKPPPNWAGSMPADGRGPRAGRRLPPGWTEGRRR